MRRIPEAIGLSVLSWREQALSRIDRSGDEAAQAVVRGLFQLLLATEVALGCQNGGVVQKNLYLLQFAGRAHASPAIPGLVGIRLVLRATYLAGGIVCKEANSCLAR